MDLAIALEKAGFSAYQWGPDVSTYAALSAGWPEGNPPLPSEAELQAAYDAALAPTVADVIAERDRRLALGFDYDFGGARGVHRIGTTESDMKGWAEVRALAAARVSASDSTSITVATNTGVVQILPSEWAAIDLAAAAFRQPIWASSFTLAAMDPIPSDYTADSYWTA